MLQLILLQCDKLDEVYGMTALMYFVDKYDINKPRIVYWTQPCPSDIANGKKADPVREFYAHAIDVKADVDWLAIRLYQSQSEIYEIKKPKTDRCSDRIRRIC